MKINQSTIDMIKRFEGCELHAYRDDAGHMTIGYGHSVLAPTPPTPHPGMTITQQEAERILAADLEHFGQKVLSFLLYTPSENQFGALVSFAFNVGIGAFSRSTLLRKYNAGDFEGAAEEFRRWTKAGGKTLRGLQRRREAERALFLSDMRATPTPQADAPVLDRLFAALMALASGVLRALGKG